MNWFVDVVWWSTDQPTVVWLASSQPLSNPPSVSSFIFSSGLRLCMDLRKIIWISADFIPKCRFWNPEPKMTWSSKFDFGLWDPKGWGCSFWVPAGWKGYCGVVGVGTKKTTCSRYRMLFWSLLYPEVFQGCGHGSRELVTCEKSEVQKLISMKTNPHHEWWSHKGPIKMVVEWHTYWQPYIYIYIRICDSWYILIYIHIMYDNDKVIYTCPFHQPWML